MNKMKPILVMIEAATIARTFLLDLQIDKVSTRTPKIMARNCGIFSKDESYVL
jgi:hypothetical protein